MKEFHTRGISSGVPLIDDDRTENHVAEKSETSVGLGTAHARGVDGLQNKTIIHDQMSGDGLDVDLGLFDASCHDVVVLMRVTGG